MRKTEGSGLGVDGKRRDVYVNSSDVDDNTRISADYKERKIEATVDKDRRKRNPVRTMTQENIETEQQVDSRSNSTAERKKMEGSKVEERG